MDPEKKEHPLGRGEKEAHALSLHLFSILDRALETEEELRKAVEDIQSFLKTHLLDDHLSVVLREDRPGVGLDAKTTFGDDLLLELYSRCEFFPCPEGGCEYAPKSFCRWCGKLKR